MNIRRDLNDPDSFLAEDWYEQYLLLNVNLNPVLHKLPDEIPQVNATQDRQQQITYEIFGSPSSTNNTSSVREATDSCEDTTVTTITQSPYPLQNLSTDDFVDEETLEHIPNELVEQNGRFYFYQERWVVRVRTIIDRYYQFVSGKFLTFAEKEKLTYCKETKKLYLDENEVLLNRRRIPKRTSESVDDKKFKSIYASNPSLTFKRKRIDRIESDWNSTPQKSLVPI